MTRKEIDNFLANTKVYVNGKSKEMQDKLFSRGYSWSDGIGVGTAEEIEKVRSGARKACLSHYFKKFNWDKCSLRFLEGILELMKSNGY